MYVYACMACQQDKVFKKKMEEDAAKLAKELQVIASLARRTTHEVNKNCRTLWYY
jgi:hypothetical protein